MKSGAATRSRDAARRAVADDVAKTRRKPRTGSLFVKLDERWTQNRKLRRVGPTAVLVFFGLVAIAGRRARAGVLTSSDVLETWQELETWRGDSDLASVLLELEAADLVLEVAGGVELVGWTREEWSAGWRRESADPCPRCRGARTVAPGFRSCEQCRERDRSRWNRRKTGANLARRSGPERGEDAGEIPEPEELSRSGRSGTAPRTAPRERCTPTPYPLLFASGGPRRAGIDNNNNNNRRAEG